MPGAQEERAYKQKVCKPHDMARPAGFEPTTPWFVAKYSIQLSYGRCKDNYYSRF